MSFRRPTFLLFSSFRRISHKNAEEHSWSSIAQNQINKLIFLIFWVLLWASEPDWLLHFWVKEPSTSCFIPNPVCKMYPIDWTQKFQAKQPQSGESELHDRAVTIKHK